MKPDRPRCKAITKAGAPCGAAPTSNGLCFFHAFPDKAAELGRIGGRRNRRARVENMPAGHMLDVVSSCERVNSLYNGLIKGGLRPAQVNSAIKLIDLHRKLQEQNDIANLQQQLQALKNMIEKRQLEVPVSAEDAYEDEEDEPFEPAKR